MAHKPTVKRQVYPSTTTTTSTVYNLTNHFSSLNSNPKYPPHSQAKSLSKSAVFVNQGKRVALESEKEVKKIEKLSRNLLEVGKRVVLESGKEGKKVEKEVVVKMQGKRVVLESGKEGKKDEEGSKKELVNGIGKRRSIGDVKVELSNFLVTNSAKLVAADMPPLVQIHAIGFARKIKDSLEKFTSKGLALSLKKEFDGVYGPAWHCIVGSSFGSFVTHSVGGFLYFSLDQKLYILLFKTTVQRAD